MSFLPFRGPGSTAFRYLGVRKSTANADCWVIRSDMDMQDDSGNHAVHRSGVSAFTDGQFYFRRPVTAAVTRQVQSLIDCVRLNPYSPSEPMPIVRRDRTNLVCAIRNDFQSQLECDPTPTIPDPTDFVMSDDPTVSFVAWQVFFLRDDYTAGGFPSSKQQWDYFQRLILLLESNSILIQSEQRRWSLTQPVAALAVASFFLSLLAFGPVSLLAYPSLGLVAILLSQFRTPSESKGPYTKIVYPFGSLRDLAIAYDATPNFTKAKFPFTDAKPAEPNRYLAYWPWILLSPLVLLIQCARVSTRITTVNPG